MKRGLLVSFLFLGTLAAALLAEGGGSATPAPQNEGVRQAAPAPAVPVAQGAPAFAAGSTIRKDPASGRLMPVRPGDVQHLLTEDLRRALSTSAEGLREVSAPGGGVMIDLQGRFRNLAWATTASGAPATVGCAADHVQPGAGKED